MQWYIIEWFGWHKIECEECHQYAVVFPSERLPKGMRFEDQLHDWAFDMMRSHITDYSMPYCMTCNKESKVTSKISKDRSYSGQIGFFNSEILKLKQSIRDWMDGWYELREHIGNLWWHHKALDNDEERAYYQNNLNRLKASAKIANAKE